MPNLKLALLVLLVLSLGCARSIPQVNLPEGYTVHQTLSLGLLKDGVTGSLEVLWDQGLEKAFKDNNEDASGLAFGYPEPDGSGEVRPAIVRQMDADGSTLQAFTLERPVASMKRSTLEGPGPVFELEVDYSTGMGSYNGPITYFLHLKGDKADWLMARDAGGGEAFKLEAMSSLKTAWEIIDAKTLLKAACRPDFKQDPSKGEAQAFVLHYYRYSLTPEGWRRFHREKPGFSEFEDHALPPRSEFP